MSVAKYTIKTNGVVVAEFNLMEAVLQPANLKLDHALTFLKDGIPDGSVQAWELVKDIRIGQQYPWRYTTPSGISYDISLMGTNLDPLRQWPKTSDFTSQP